MINPDETLEDVIKAENAIFVTPDGYFDPPGELDDRNQNMITVRKIEAFFRKHGTGWLGRINRYSQDKDKPYLENYVPGETGTYNYSFTYAIPQYDEQLVQLIQGREHAEYTGTKEDGERIDVIFARIAELGGIHLHWV